MRTVSQTIGFLTLALAAPIAAADAFWCGRQIVREGMSAPDIQRICGNADRIRTQDEPVYTRLDNGALLQVGVDTRHYWYYDRGPNQFVARITIRDAIAETIELLQVRDIESVPEEDPQRRMR